MGNLLSGLRDLSGFAHISSTTSPLTHTNPFNRNTISIDVSQSAPTYAIRLAGDAEPPDADTSIRCNTYPVPAVCSFGASSSNYGASSSWQPLSSPNTALGQCYSGATSPCYYPGYIDIGANTVVANGQTKPPTVVWSTIATNGGQPTYPVYSDDLGQHWQNSTTDSSADIADLSKAAVVSDRVNPNRFYLLQTNGNNAVCPSVLYQSTFSGGTYLGGKEFSFVSNLDYSGGTERNCDGILHASPGADGDVWLASANHGLFHNSNCVSGKTGITCSGTPSLHTVNSTITQAFALAFGARASGSIYPTVYLSGVVNGTYGIFKSTDYLQTDVTQINGVLDSYGNTQNLYGQVNCLAADPKQFGIVYLCTGGRGVIEGIAPGVQGH